MRGGILALVLAACSTSESVPCGDRVCGEGSVCGRLAVDGQEVPICLTPEQSTACAGSDDGARCEADDRGSICYQRYCLPGCGDGTLDVGEECDDANFVSHDGCSSACLSESAGWREWISAWKGRAEHATGYHAQSQKLVIVGGFDTLGLLGDQWVRDAQGTWTQSQPDVAMRRGAAMAYDSIRHRLVLFGGFTSELLGDTWEYDGTTWTKRAPAVSPSPRSLASMAFDPTTGHVVLFGGRGSGAYLNDTWEYDGTTWIPITVASPPAGRQWAAMAWDAARSRIVMFGGYASGTRVDTCEYANGTWTIFPNLATRPAGRFGATMAFSTQRNKIVLYGGQVSLTAAVSDTWEYDGAWTAISPALTPPARGYATLTADADGLVLTSGLATSQLATTDMWRYGEGGFSQWREITPEFSPSNRHSLLVYDTNLRAPMLFSGCSAGAYSVPDTWVFDIDLSTLSVAWVRPTDGANDPPQRCYAAVSHDPKRARTIVFGGSTAGGTANLTDTWQWDGTSWAQATTATTPPARLDAAFASHVLFGGRVDNSTKLGDTWEFDGSTWTERTTPTGLGAQDRAAMAYDPDADRVVLFDTTGATWVFANHAWSRLELDGSPGARVGARMVWDLWRHRMVLFGGNLSATGEDLADLWELTDTRWERVRLLGAQPPTRPRPGLAAYPELRGLVMFGGNAREDTWVLQWVSDTPEERCNNAMDDDGDLQIDNADPDCTLFR